MVQGARIDTIGEMRTPPIHARLRRKQLAWRALGLLYRSPPTDPHLKRLMKGVLHDDPSAVRDFDALVGEVMARRSRAPSKERSHAHDVIISRAISTFPFEGRSADPLPAWIHAVVACILLVGISLLASRVSDLEVRVRDLEKMEMMPLSRMQLIQ
jgi:hypothetical protein